MKEDWYFDVNAGEPVLIDQVGWTFEGVEWPTVKLVHSETGEIWEPEVQEFLDLNPKFPNVHRAPKVEQLSARLEAFRSLDVFTRERLERLAANLNELKTGKKFWPGESPEGVEVNEKYDPGTTMTERIRTKVAELSETDLNYKERRWWDLLRIYDPTDVSSLISFRQAGRPRKNFQPYLDVLSDVYSNILKNGARVSLGEVLDRALAQIEHDESLSGIMVPSRSQQFRLLRGLRDEWGVTGSNWRYAQSRHARPEASHQRPQALMPGERLQADTTRLNVLVRDYFGRVFRPEMSIVICMVTRMILALIVTKSTKARDIAALMLEVFTPKPDAAPFSPEAHYNILNGNARHLLKYFEGMGNFGPATGVVVVPRVLEIDRGRAFENEWMENLSRIMGFRIELSRPYTPTDKPHIERVFRTFEPVLEKLPGYVGRNVTERGRGTTYASDELLTMEEVETLLKGWVYHFYHHTPHKGLIFAEGRHEGISVALPGL